MDEIVERRVEAGGVTLELRRRGGAFEVWADGRRALASDVARAERSLAELALAPLAGRDDLRILLVGINLGRTLHVVLEMPGVRKVDVVEPSRALLDWYDAHLTAPNAARDPRLQLHHGELSTYLKQVHVGPDGEWQALLVDLAQHPLTTAESARRQLGDEALSRFESALRPGGVLALWSSAREPELARRLHARFQNVAEVAVPVELDGVAALDYVYRGRRHPPPPAAPSN